MSEVVLEVQGAERRLRPSTLMGVRERLGVLRVELRPMV